MIVRPFRILKGLGFHGKSCQKVTRWIQFNAIVIFHWCKQNCFPLKAKSLPVCRSVGLLVCLSVFLSVCLPAYLPACLPTGLSVCKSVHPFVHSFACSFVYLSVGRFVYLFIRNHRKLGCAYFTMHVHVPVLLTFSECTYIKTFNIRTNLESLIVTLSLREISKTHSLPSPLKSSD